MSNSLVRERIIRSRYMVKGVGWQVDDVKITATLEDAHYEASKRAKQLDADYGDSHFWTVDIYTVDYPEYGSAAQLFHGRLI